MNERLKLDDSDMTCQRLLLAFSEPIDRESNLEYLISYLDFQLLNMQRDSDYRRTVEMFSSWKMTESTVEVTCDLLRWLKQVTPEK
jgi:hypothetical protein